MSIKEEFQLGDLSRAWVAIDDALAMMSAAGVPQYYLEGLRPSLHEVVLRRDPEKPYRPTSCYLAFYGDGIVSSHLKVGVAKDCKKRFMGAATDCPLQRMWCYEVRFNTREHAASVERLCLDNLKDARVKGEWVVVHGIRKGVADQMAADLGAYAQSITGSPVVFQEIGE